MFWCLFFCSSCDDWAKVDQHDFILIRRKSICFESMTHGSRTGSSLHVASTTSMWTVCTNKLPLFSDAFHQFIKKLIYFVPCSNLPLRRHVPHISRVRIWHPCPALVRIMTTHVVKNPTLEHLDTFSFSSLFLSCVTESQRQWKVPAVRRLNYSERRYSDSEMVLSGGAWRGNCWGTDVRQKSTSRGERNRCTY